MSLTGSSRLSNIRRTVFEQEEDPSARSFFSEIISSISDVRFSYDGRYILSRDYLTVKIWDVNMERQPVKTIPIHEHLRPRLCDTYENDSIFDKFEVVFSGDSKNVMTGSYNNNFMIYPSDPEKEVEVVLQADKSAFKAKKVGVPTPINSSTSPTANGGKKNGSRAGSPAGAGQRMRKETDADQIDFNKKILHMSWHPFEDSIAIAATNNVSPTTPADMTMSPLLTRRYSCSCSQPCRRPPHIIMVVEGSCRVGLASTLVVSCSLGLLQGHPRILASRPYVTIRPHAFMSLAAGGLKLDGSVGHDCWGLVRHHKLWGIRRAWGHARPLNLRGRTGGESVRHQGDGSVVVGEDVEINALEWREGKQVVWHRDHPQPRQIRDMIRLRSSSAFCD